MARSRMAKLKRARGRPSKFGRPSRPVTVTLPHDVLSRLTAIDTDLGRAIVTTVERVSHRRPRAPVAAAEVSAYGSHAVILVNPVRALKRHAKRIVHVHCKDIRKEKLEQATKNDWSFLDAVVGEVFAVPGDGSIDFEPILRNLAGAGYAGWLVVEADQDPAKAHPLTHARIGHDCLGPLAQRYWKA